MNGSADPFQVEGEADRGCLEDPASVAQHRLESQIDPVPMKGRAFHSHAGVWHFCLTEVVCRQNRREGKELLRQRRLLHKKAIYLLESLMVVGEVAR